LAVAIKELRSNSSNRQNVVEWGVGAFRRPSRTEPKMPEQGILQLPFVKRRTQFSILFLFTFYL